MSTFAELATKKARIAHIRTMLATNPQWAVRGLVRIYENQTEDEQQSEDTRYDNGIGFSGADANILSSFAKQVNAGRTLSAKQMSILHARIPKYAKQLESISKRD